MNTLKQDIDALNWSVMGPKFRNLAKYIVKHAYEEELSEGYDISFEKHEAATILRLAEQLLRETEHLDV